MENNFFRNIKPLLALFIMLMGFTYFFVVTIYEKQNDQVLIAVVSLASMACSYYFGSSSGTSRKDETINTLSNKPTITNSESTVIVNKDEK